VLAVWLNFFRWFLLTVDGGLGTGARSLRTGYDFGEWFFILSCGLLGFESFNGCVEATGKNLYYESW